jgi:hypothetical protein
VHTLALKDAEPEQRSRSVKAENRGCGQPHHDRSQDEGRRERRPVHATSGPREHTAPDRLPKPTATYPRSANVPD